MVDQADPAHVLFPGDAPTNPPEWFEAQRAGAEARLMGSQKQEPEKKPAPSEDDAANVLFPTERNGLDYAGIVDGELDNALMSALKDGDDDRVAEIKTASTALANDFKAAGTDEASISEAFDIIRQSQGLVPMTEEQHAKSRADGMAAITEAGISEADLGLARAFVKDLITVSPQIKYQLEAYGAGNNPKLIAAAVKEAKRRGYK